MRVGRPQLQYRAKIVKGTPNAIARGAGAGRQESKRASAGGKGRNAGELKGILSLGGFVFHRTEVVTRQSKESW